MTILGTRSALRIRPRIANLTVRPLFCHPVMQPDHSPLMGPNTVSARFLRGAYKETPVVARPSLMEPLFIDQTTGDEFDPRNHGYRVVPPHRSFATAVKPRTADPFPAAVTFPPSNNDEYDFIMSSPCPVSDEQCVQLRKDDTQNEDNGNAPPLVTPRQMHETVLTEDAESVTDWVHEPDHQDNEVDEEDMSAD